MYGTNAVVVLMVTSCVWYKCGRCFNGDKLCMVHKTDFFVMLFMTLISVAKTDGSRLWWIAFSIIRTRLCWFIVWLQKCKVVFVVLFVCYPMIFVVHIHAFWIKLVALNSTIYCAICPGLSVLTLVSFHAHEVKLIVICGTAPQRIYIAFDNLN